MTARRVDTNHAEIVADLRRCGYLVVDIHEVGHGCPDITVAVPGCGWVMLEIKSPGGRMTPDELDFQQRAEAAGGQYAVITSTEAALDILGRMEGRE